MKLVSSFVQSLPLKTAVVSRFQGENVPLWSAFAGQPLFETCSSHIQELLRPAFVSILATHPCQ
jgi:hypothetical protein